MKRFGTSWCWLSALMVALFGLCPCLVYAQASSVDAPLSESSSSGSSLAKTFSVHFPVAERQSISLGTEIMKAASAPKDLTKEARARPAWDITAVPITLGYSYELADPSKGIVPVIGVGLSYYFCEVRKHEMMDESGSILSSALLPGTFRKERGMGYGAQITMGLRTNLPYNMFVQTQGRAHYINGLAFMGRHDKELGSEYTKLDFTLGFGYRF